MAPNPPARAARPSAEAPRLTGGVAFSVVSATNSHGASSAMVPIAAPFFLGAGTAAAAPRRAPSSRRRLAIIPNLLGCPHRRLGRDAPLPRRGADEVVDVAGAQPRRRIVAVAVAGLPNRGRPRRPPSPPARGPRTRTCCARRGRRPSRTPATAPGTAPPGTRRRRSRPSSSSLSAPAAPRALRRIGFSRWHEEEWLAVLLLLVVLALIALVGFGISSTRLEASRFIEQCQRVAVTSARRRRRHLVPSRLHLVAKSWIGNLLRSSVGPIEAVFRRGFNSWKWSGFACIFARFRPRFWDRIDWSRWQGWAELCRENLGYSSVNSINFSWIWLFQT